MTSIAINSENFFKSLEEDRFNDIQISTNFEVTIDSTIVTWHHRIIKNVVFKEKVVIRDCEINSGIKFTNCKFEKGIVFHNVKSTNYNSTYNPNNESVCFENSEATFIVFESNCFLDRSLTFKKECKIEKLYITNFENRNAGISIRNSIFNDVIISESKTEINFSNSIFQKSTRFELIIGDVTFVKNEFQEDIMIWNLECPYGLTLNYNLFKDRFEVDASRIKQLNIFGDTFSKKSKYDNTDTTNRITNTYLKKIHITEAIFIEGFEFNGTGKVLEKLEIPLIPASSGLLKFENWNIDNTILSGVNQNLKLLFIRINFKLFEIKDFTNYSDISFHKCKGVSNSELNLVNADLGSTKFNEFEFDTFKEIKVDNVVLDKINPTSCNWFEDKVLTIIDDTQSKEIQLKRKREVYRQLKQALKNNGNQIDSLNFQSREFSAYRKQLKIAKGKSRGDKIIMWVSQSNDFGLNWLKPAKIVFFATLFLYIILLPVISNQIEYGISLTDWSTTLSAFTSNSKSFWLLFNPIRKIDDVYGQNISGLIYFLDLLHKIFLGVMIFQIIKAFRKYVSN